ncbi:MAG: hypothetical protein HFH34_16290 [Eubacterium sp.]|nr:hypothetical protein [Eubacterium sp.]
MRIWQRKGKLVRAALESIAYQITDIIRAMVRDSKRDILKSRINYTYVSRCLAQRVQ